MPFYNPYQKTPDWGSGAQDIISQLMQMIMMNRMFPQNKTTESLGATEPTGGSPLRAGPLQGQAPASMPPTGGPPMQGGAGMPPMGGPGGSPMPQMNPQMMQMLMQMLMQRQQQQPPTPQFGR